MSNERDLEIRLQAESLSGDELNIRRVVGVDRISHLFSYEIEAERFATVDEDTLLLKPASLVFTTPDGEEVQRVFGMISRVRDLAEPHMAHPRYELTLVPRAFAATMREMLDIFMEMSIPEIIETCLTRCGLEAGEHFDLGGLVDTYPKKEFVVQYRETDFAFISRLCEHHGIWFIVDHAAGKDVLTFGDRNTAFPSSERTPELRFAPVEANHGAFFEHIASVDITRLPLPKRYTVRDYNYRIPGVDLLASVDVDPEGLGEVVDYGSHFKNPDEGTWLASIRAQELKAHARTWTCLGTAPALCAGQRFTLTEHPSGDRELLVTSVRREHGTEDSATQLTTTITAILAATPFRPQRLTPKPHINGVITGMIDAGVKDGYADVDEQGRYRVRFMFDTAGRGEGQASRLVRMAQPHAGEGYGMHFPLRPGTEVILSCVDGDPDRPIITGTVPNPATLSPVSSGNRDRNMIRTGGGNEIDISDEDGAHRIKMSTPHADTIFQLGAPNAPEIGAIVSTSGSMVSQVADTVGAMADVHSAFQEIKGSVTGKSSTTVTGMPNPIKGFDKVEKMVSSGVAAAKALAGTVDQVMGFGKKMVDSQKKRDADRLKAAEDAIIAYGPKPQEYPKDRKKATAGEAPNIVEVAETEAQFRTRVVDEAIKAFSGTAAELVSELKEARANADPAIGVPKPNLTGLKLPTSVPEELSYLVPDVIERSLGDAYADSSVKAAVDATLATVEAGVKTAGAARKLFSSTHKKMQDLIDTAAWGGSRILAGGIELATGISAPRRPKLVRLPAEHYDLTVATDSVVHNGVQGYYALSPNTSYLYGGNGATVASNVSLSLYGGKGAELAAGRVSITSTTLFDVESRRAIFVKSGKSTRIKVGSWLRVVSDDDTTHESKKKFFIKTKELLSVDGGDEAKLEAKKWDVKATDSTYDLYVKGAMTTKSDASVAVDVSNGDAKLEILPSEIRMEKKSGGALTLQESSAHLEQHGGASLNLSSSSADLSATTVKVKGDTLDINGTKIFLG